MSKTVIKLNHQHLDVIYEALRIARAAEKKGYYHTRYKPEAYTSIIEAIEEAMLEEEVLIKA